MKPRNITASLAVLALAAIASPATATENILFNCFFPPQHFVCKEIVPEMASRVESATDGRVKLRIPPKSLTAPPDVYDGVANGVMDGGLQFNAFLAGVAPGIQFSLLPFIGYEEAEPSSVALWETYQKFFGDKGEYGDVVLLSVYASAGADIFSMTDDPIETVEDIANRKMWGLPGAVANVLKAAGSPVVAGPAVQMLEIISKGVVDGYAGVPLQSVYAFKLFDYTKSVTVFERKIFQPTFSFFVSKSKWDAIAPEDQEAIRSVLGGDFAAFAGSVNDKYQNDARARLIEAKMPMIEGSPETLEQLLALGSPMYDAWKERVGAMGVDGDEVIAYYQQAYEAAKVAAK